MGNKFCDNICLERVNINWPSGYLGWDWRFSGTLARKPVELRGQGVPTRTLPPHGAACTPLLLCVSASHPKTLLLPLPDEENTAQ